MSPPRAGAPNIQALMWSDCSSAWDAAGGSAIIWDIHDCKRNPDSDAVIVRPQHAPRVPSAAVIRLLFANLPSCAAWRSLFWEGGKFLELIERPQKGEQTPVES